MQKDAHTASKTVINKLGRNLDSSRTGNCGPCGISILSLMVEVFPSIHLLIYFFFFSFKEALEVKYSTIHTTVYNHVHGAIVFDKMKSSITLSGIKLKALDAV